VGIGSVIGPLVGGLLATLNYGWLFVLSALIGVLALGLLHFTVLEPRRQKDFFAVE